MATTREVITKWGFNVEHEPLDKLEHQLEEIKGRLEFLAAAEVIKGIYELAERFANFAEQTHLAAISAGLTVESFQKLAFAAQQSSVSQEEMSGAMARLGRHLYEARQGGEQAQQIFSKAGFTSSQIQGFRTSSDVMLALADRFKNIQDPIQKQAIAMQLLGRGSFNMVGFLSQGSAALKGMGDQAEKLGAVLSGEQIEALVDVEHAFGRLFAVVKAFAATIAAYFAPSIKYAVQQFLDFYEANRKILDLNVREFVWDITYAMGACWAAVKIVTQAFLDFASTHPVLVRRIIEIVIALGTFVGALWAAQKMIGLLKGSFGVLQTAVEPFMWLWEKAFGPAVLWVGQLAKTALLSLLETLWTLTATAFPSLSAAIFGLGAAIEATPVGWLLTGLAAVIVVLHDLYTMIFGSGKWEDTWISKAIDAAKGVGGKIMSFFGFGDDANKGPNAADAMNAATNLNNASSVNGIPGLPGGDKNSSSITQTNNFEINVPPGTDHKMVGEKVQQGVKDHLDEVYRRTNQQLAPAVVR